MATTLLAVAAKSAAGPRSTVARGVHALPDVPTNLSSTERWVSLIGGGLLATFGYTGRGPGLCSGLAAGYLLYRAATGHCLGYQALGVSTADPTNDEAVIAAGHGTRVEHALAVRKPVAEVYGYWRDLEHLPRFMTHLVDVDTTTDGRSHWTARGPFGLTVEWDAEIVTDEPNRLIAWKSLDGSDVDTAGSVRFTELPGDRGTEVRVNLKYDPPAGKVGTAVAGLFGRSPRQEIRADLRRLKQILEAGEAPTVAGQPRGAC
jgi:uncharacterized membrane protein